MIKFRRDPKSDVTGMVAHCNRDTYPTLESAISDHFVRWRSNRGTNSNNAHRGRAFEACIYDWLVQFVGATPDQIEHYKDKRFNVEADFLFNTKPKVALMVKTSMRERWKQWDRDALYLKNTFPSIKVFGVFLNERDDDDDERVINHRDQIAGFCGQLDGVFAVRLPSDTRRLATLIRKATGFPNPSA